jgi:hypothetical protein
MLQTTIIGTNLSKQFLSLARLFASGACSRHTKATLVADKCKDEDDGNVVPYLLWKTEDNQMHGLLLKFKWVVFIPNVARQFVCKYLS